MSECLTELIPALLKAQAKFGVVVKDKVAKVRTKAGVEYTYKYADLSAVLDAVMQPLREEGLCLMQGIRQDAPGFLTVESLLIHASSGQFISESTTMPVLDPGPQGFGSVAMYCRRYSSTALLGVVPSDDDDAALAQAPQTRNTATQLCADEYAKMDADMRALIDDLAGRVILLLANKDLSGAHAEIEAAQLDQEAKMALWSKLDSKQRSAIKKHAQSLKGE